jgi:hypothetical protein
MLAPVFCRLRIDIHPADGILHTIGRRSRGAVPMVRMVIVVMGTVPVRAGLIVLMIAVTMTAMALLPMIVVQRARRSFGRPLGRQRRRLMVPVSAHGKCSPKNRR